MKKRLSVDFMDVDLLTTFLMRHAPPEFRIRWSTKWEVDCSRRACDTLVLHNWGCSYSAQDLAMGAAATKEEIDAELGELVNLTNATFGSTPRQTAVTAERAQKRCSSNSNLAKRN